MDYESVDRYASIAGTSSGSWSVFVLLLLSAFILEKESNKHNLVTIVGNHNEF